MPTTLDDVMCFLEHWNIQEDVTSQTAGDMQWRMVVYKVIPENLSGGTIDIIFDESRESIHSVGWRNWHAHFDNHADERVNVRNALRFARNIIRQRYVLVEYSGESGVYIASGVERAYDYMKFIRENTELYEKCAKTGSVSHYRISRFNVGCAIIPEKVEQVSGGNGD